LSEDGTRIRLFVMDVDGTLTDGTITYTAEGTEIKSFHARDGAGIKLLPAAGIRPAIVSGRSSPVTERRARELGIEDVVQGAKDKIEAVDEIRRRMEIAWPAVAFVGDDLSDLPVMLRAGFSAAPADADAEVRNVATYVCREAGGRGAVREAIEILLRNQGSWAAVLRGLGASERAEEIR
jgi:3-deoxy-D-manno-octulosonate 8-phosphate phosphatase (KDO 8-P phosphatase)